MTSSDERLFRRKFTNGYGSTVPAFACMKVSSIVNNMITATIPDSDMVPANTVFNSEVPVAYGMVGECVVMPPCTVLHDDTLYGGLGLNYARPIPGSWSMRDETDGYRVSGPQTISGISGINLINLGVQPEGNIIRAAILTSELAAQVAESTAGTQTATATRMENFVLEPTTTEVITLTAWCYTPKCPVGTRVLYTVIQSLNVIIEIFPLLVDADLPVVEGGPGEPGEPGDNVCGCVDLPEMFILNWTGSGAMSCVNGVAMQMYRSSEGPTSVYHGTASACSGHTITADIVCIDDNAPTWWRMILYCDGIQIAIFDGGLADRTHTEFLVECSTGIVEVTGNEKPANPNPCMNGGGGGGGSGGPAPAGSSPQTGLSADAEVNAAFTLTVQFSKPVTGFVVGDITIAEATLGALTTVDADTYTVTVTPTGATPILIDVAAAVCQDTVDSWDNSAAIQLSIPYDTTSPTIVLTTPDDPVSALFVVTATITDTSASVVGFVLADIDVVNGTASNFTEVSAKVFTVDITPTGSTPITIDVDAAKFTDLAGNNNTAASQLSVVYSAVGSCWIAEDTFTDTNSTALTAHTMETGAGWDYVSGGAWDIQSNGAESVGMLGNGGFITTTTLYSDCTITADVTLAAAGGPGGGICWRLQDYNNHWWFQIGYNNRQELIERYVGTGYVRDFNTQSTGVGSSHAAKIVLSGNDMSAYIGGTLLCSYTSTRFNTLKKHGLGSYQTTPPDKNKYDNFCIE